MDFLNPPTTARAWLTGVLVVSLALYACNPLCEVVEESTLQADCPPIAAGEDTLWIADFERGSNPTLLGGNINFWSDPAEEIAVDLWHASAPPYLAGSQFAAGLSITGNEVNAYDTVRWKGAGFLLRLTCEDGLDIRGADSLVFHLRSPHPEHLRFTEIRLEDTSQQNTPVRLLMQFGTLSREWQMPSKSSWKIPRTRGRSKSTSLITGRPSGANGRWSGFRWRGLVGVSGVRQIIKRQ